MNMLSRKKEWIYVALLCLAVLIFTIPNLIGKAAENTGNIQKSETEKAGASLFFNFEETKARSLKAEQVLGKDSSTYLLYASSNMMILLIFLLGLLVDGYFISGILKKNNVLKKTATGSPPPIEIWQTLIIFVLWFAFGNYVAGIIIGILTATAGVLTGIDVSFFKNQNFNMIFGTIVMNSILFIIILLFLWNVRKVKLAGLGFEKKNLGKNLIYGLCGYLAIIPVIFLVGIIIYVILNVFHIKPPPQPIVGLFLEEDNTKLIIISSVLAAILGPAIEEIFFRGIMYNSIRGKLGIFWGILITSALFSYMHTYAVEHFLVIFIPIFILGAALAYLYEKTGSLIPSITLHVLNNAGSVIMVFLLKYFNKLIA